MPTSVVSTPCCCSDSCSTRPRASTSARLIDCAPARCSNVTGGSVHELFAGSSSDVSPSASRPPPASASASAARSAVRRRRWGRRRSRSPASYGPAGPSGEWRRRRRCRPLGGRRRRPSASSSGSSSLLSDEISLERPLGGPPDRHGDERHAAPGARGHRAQRRLGDQHHADEQRAEQEHHRADVGEQRPQRFADDPADHPAGVAHAVDGEALGPLGDVQQAEAGETDERPPEHQPPRARRAAVADQRRCRATTSSGGTR